MIVTKPFFEMKMAKVCQIESYSSTGESYYYDSTKKIIGVKAGQGVRARYKYHPDYEDVDIKEPVLPERNQDNTD